MAEFVSIHKITLHDDVVYLCTSDFKNVSIRDLKNVLRDGLVPLPDFTVLSNYIPTYSSNERTYNTTTTTTIVPEGVTIEDVVNATIDDDISSIVDSLKDELKDITHDIFQSFQKEMDEECEIFEDDVCHRNDKFDISNIGNILDL
jgi:hypothetical protein